MTSSYPDNVTPLFGAPRQKPSKRAAGGGKPAGKRSPGGHRGEKLDENVAHFVRALRRAGLRLGPAATLDCVEACRTVDIGNRVEFYHALSSCLVKQPEDRLVFDQAFHIFWRNPRLMEKMRDLLLPSLARETERDADDEPTSRRVDEALGSDKAPEPEPADDESIEIDMSMTSSKTELLQSTDFQMMSAAEIAEAERAIDGMVPAPRGKDHPVGPHPFQHFFVEVARRPGNHLAHLASFTVFGDQGGGDAGLDRFADCHHHGAHVEHAGLAQGLFVGAVHDAGLHAGLHLTQFIHRPLRAVHGQHIRSVLKQFPANGDAETAYADDREAESFAALGRAPLPPLLHPSPADRAQTYRSSLG